jgi:hypothetical protein
MLKLYHVHRIRDKWVFCGKFRKSRANEGFAEPCPTQYEKNHKRHQRMWYLELVSRVYGDMEAEQYQSQWR